jgi:hypothetical protein
MDLDDLIRHADPARGQRYPPVTAEDARQLIDLMTAGRSPLGSRTFGLRRIGWVRALGVALPVVVVVVVAVVFLHAGGARGPETIGQGAHRTSAGSIEQQLVGELGVLREPQTPAARALNHSPNLGPHRLTINPALTRVVRLVRGIRVLLYVATGGQHGELGGLGVNELRGQNGFGECCTTPAALQHPGTPGPLAGSSAPHPHQVYVEVVPDGVARVRWTFPKDPSVGRTPHADIGPFAHSLTTTVVVRENIAAAVLPDRWAAQTVVWYDASGRVIARHSSR